jgi:transcriptional regulator with XRE-family HTH domain
MMGKVGLQNLGRRLVEERGETGIRKTAKEIGISPATLSRVERGYLPDLETFTKICRWLKVDPAEILALKSSATHSPPKAAVHFRKQREISPKTAQALAQLIIAVQRALVASQKLEE